MPPQFWQKASNTSRLRAADHEHMSIDNTSKVLRYTQSSFALKSFDSLVHPGHSKNQHLQPPFPIDGQQQCRMPFAHAYPT